MSARDALVTILVCLGLWAVLYAPVLERDAESSPVGARRTAALAILRPLRAAADAVGMGSVSESAMRALGRDPDAPPGGELDLPDLPPLPPIGLEEGPARPSPQGRPSPSPPHHLQGGGQAAGDSGSQETQEETAPEIRTPTQTAKLRVAIVGDSLSQGLGPAIAQWFDPDVSRVLSLGRESTGLARQDYFNWQSAMRQIELEFRPDVLVVLLGSNDNQAQVTKDGDALPVGSVEWARSYRELVEAFLDEATSNGTHVIWVGIPVVRDHDRWEFYRRVNDIYREAAAADPLATYVDAWSLLQPRSGGYSAYLRNEHGVLQEMRASDGIHLTPAGYGYLARATIRAAARAFDLPQRAVSINL